MKDKEKLSNAIDSMLDSIGVTAQQMDDALSGNKPIESEYSLKRKALYSAEAELRKAQTLVETEQDNLLISESDVYIDIGSNGSAAIGIQIFDDALKQVMQDFKRVDLDARMTEAIEFYFEIRCYGNDDKFVEKKTVDVLNEYVENLFIKLQETIKSNLKNYEIVNDTSPGK